MRATTWASNNIGIPLRKHLDTSWLRSMAGGAAAAPAGPAGDPLLVDANGNGIPDLIDQRRADAAEMLDPTSIYNDSRFARAQAALDALDAMGVPYTPEVVDMLGAQASDRSSVAANTQRQLLQEQMERTGGNISDPSYMAAQRGIDASRMGMNQTQRREIALQALLQNYEAEARRNQAVAEGNRGLGATVQGLANPLRAQQASNLMNMADEPLSNQSGVTVGQASPGVRAPSSTYQPPRQEQNALPTTTPPQPGASLPRAPFNPAPPRDYPAQPAQFAPTPAQLAQAQAAQAQAAAVSGMVNALQQGGMTSQAPTFQRRKTRRAAMA